MPKRKGQETSHIQRTPFQKKVSIRGVPYATVKERLYEDLFPVYGHDWFFFAEPYLDVEIDDDE